MEVSPVTRYREPGYPTRDILRDHPELLSAAPVRWQRNAALMSVLATSLTLVLPAWAGEDGVRPSVDVPVKIEQLLPTDNEPRLMGDVAVPVAPVPQGIVILTFTPTDRAIREGNVLTAPVRLVAQYLGAQVNYDGRTGTTTVTRGETTLELTRGRVARINGNPVTLPAPVRYRKPALYAPVRFLAEQLDARVEWDAKSDEIRIISATKPTMLLKVRHLHAQQPSPPEHPAVTLDQRREALRDYVAWLKAQEMI